MSISRRTSASQLNHSNPGSMDITGMSPGNHSMLGSSPPFGMSPNTLAGLKEARKRVRSPTIPIGISDPELEGEYPQKRHVSEYMARDLSSHMSLQGPVSLEPVHSHQHGPSDAGIQNAAGGVHVSGTTSTPVHTPAQQSSENTLPREMSADMDGPNSQALMSDSSLLMSEHGLTSGHEDDSSPAGPASGGPGSAGQSWQGHTNSGSGGGGSNSGAVHSPAMRISTGQAPSPPMETLEAGPSAAGTGAPLSVVIGGPGFPAPGHGAGPGGFIAPAPGRRISESLFRSLSVGLNVSGQPSGLGGGTAGVPAAAAGMQHAMHSPFQRLGMPQLPNLEMMPASPSDARFTFSDLRKTALLRSLLQRTEDTATQAYSAGPMDTSTTGAAAPDAGAPPLPLSRLSASGQEAMSPARPQPNAPSGGRAVGMQLGGSGLVVGGPGGLGPGPAAAVSSLMRRVSSGHLGGGLLRPPPSPIIPPQYTPPSTIQGCISPPAHTSSLQNCYGSGAGPGSGGHRVRGTSPSLNSHISHGHSDSCLDTANSMSTSDSSGDSCMDEEVEQVRRAAPVNLSPAGIIAALPLASFPVASLHMPMVHQVPGGQPVVGALVAAPAPPAPAPAAPAILSAAGIAPAQRISPHTFKLRPGALSTIPEGDFKIAAAAGSPHSTSPPGQTAGGLLLPACPASPAVSPVVLAVGVGPVSCSPLDRTSVASALGLSPSGVGAPQHADERLLAHVRAHAREETHKLAMEEREVVHALPPSTHMLAAIAEHTAHVSGGHPPGHSPLADMHH